MINPPSSTITFCTRSTRNYKNNQLITSAPPTTTPGTLRPSYSSPVITLGVCGGFSKRAGPPRFRWRGFDELHRLPWSLKNQTMNKFSASTVILGRPRLIKSSLLGRLSRPSIEPRTFYSSSPCRSHQNPLGLPGHQAGLPRSGSPPKLNISRSLPTKRDIPNVRKVLVVASGKGGVGKSTVAVNLAIALRNLSTLKVGLLDLDIFGPSVPKLMGLDEGLSPELTNENALVPLRNHGISCMSIGFLIPSSESPDSVVAWRGMMVMKAVQQLLFDVDWRGRTEHEDPTGLDVLVIDMPPGTGDVALSLGQLVNIHGAVIVTTPQDIALIDVTKGVNMFRKLNIPIIGSVLNMSTFKCPKCDTKHEIFGPMTSFKRVLERHQVDLLGEVPLDLQISKSSDSGQPISIANRPPHLHPGPPNPNVPDTGTLDNNPFIEISRKCLDHLGP